MLKIDRKDFDCAVDVVTAAAINVTDAQGLKVRARLPDRERIEAIVLGALVAMVGGPAHLADTYHFSALDLAKLGAGQ